jgi:ribosomal protein S18 acetylase RimI-like enzyme
MTTSLKIRNAKPDEAFILAEAEREIAKVPGRLASQPEELKDESFRQKIISLSQHPNGVFVVAELDGNLVGHAFLEPRDLAVIAHVVNLTIAVHEGYQGKGIGKKLMGHLIQWAKANPHVEKVELHVRSINEHAIALYKDLGFKEEGRKIKRLKLGPNKYVDDVYMALWVGE